MEHPMCELNDLSRSFTSLEQDKTIIAVIEMSQSSWLVAGIVPGIERHPLKKLEPNEEELVRLLMRWRAEATKIGRTIIRIAVAFEAGRDGFWLTRWLRARDIDAYVIHPTSVAISREHRRAKSADQALGEGIAGRRARFPCARRRKMRTTVYLSGRSLQPGREEAWDYGGRGPSRWRHAQPVYSDQW
jgi:transposase